MKCRWCDFEIPSIWTTKDGKKRNGWVFLLEHQEREHPDEYDALHNYSDGAEPEDDDDDAG